METTHDMDAKQKKMRQIWERVFERPVEPDTDFFVDLEGDSKAAAMLAYGINLAFGVEVPMVEVFEHPTPARLTEVVARLQAN
jgi:acyl carrier protein